MDFFKNAGKIAIGSRLRMLTEKITEDASLLYSAYHIDMEPKWFPVFYVLSQGGAQTITNIAREIGHSHPSVSKIIREMSTTGFVKEKKDKTDGRKNMVQLSAKGNEITIRIQDQYKDVGSAINELTKQTRNDLWEAIGEWEYLLNEKSLWLRVLEQKKRREGNDVEIVEYNWSYRKAFKDLNERWIKKYFKMEAADYKTLDNPEGYILKNGGYICVALYKNDPVGVCALMKMDDSEYDFELVKMAVSPEVQGKGIGWLMGRNVIDKDRALGAGKIYLESNTILKPAIKLYQKLGFRKIAGHSTPYERCNIQMALEFIMHA